jgi:hypothetical protein
VILTFAGVEEEAADDADTAPDDEDKDEDADEDDDDC